MKQHILGFLRQGGAALVFCLLLMLCFPGCAVHAQAEDLALQLDQTVYEPGGSLALRYYKAGKNASLELQDENGNLLETWPLALGDNALSGSAALPEEPGSYLLTYYAAPKSAGISREIWITDQSFYSGKGVYEAKTDGFFSLPATKGEGAWVGVYPADSGEPAAAPEVWGYLPTGSQNIHTGALADGPKSFRDLEPGDYAAYYFPENDYQYSQYFPFRIEDTGALKANYTSAPDALGTAEGTVTIFPNQTKTGLYYWLVWGDRQGPLPDYAPLASAAAGDRAVAIAIPAGTEAPEGADRFYIYPGNIQEKSRLALPYVLPIPGKIRADAGRMLFSFVAVTDSHMTQTPFHRFNRQYKGALDDIAASMSGSSALINLGDLVNNGKESEYQAFAKLTEEYRKKLPPQYFLIGNHDLALNRKNAEEQKALYLQYTGMPDLWYQFAIRDYAFICLGSQGAEEGTSAQSEWAYLSEPQLLWLEEQLAAAEERGGRETPIFVFLHQPLLNTLAGASYQVIAEDARLREILSAYPQAILFSGHTHEPLDGGDTLWQGDFRAAHTGCISRLWDTEKQRHNRGSQGCLVEVYANGVRVRGRNFLTKTWLAAGQLWLPNLPPEEPAQPPQEGEAGETTPTPEEETPSEEESSSEAGEDSENPV